MKPLKMENLVSSSVPTFLSHRPKSKLNRARSINEKNFKTVESVGARSTYSQPRSQARSLMKSRSKSKKAHKLQFGSQRSATALSDAGSQSKFYQIAQEKYSEDLKVKHLLGQVKDLKSKNQDQQKDLVQERQKSSKLQDMVEKLIVKLKNYYSKSQPKDQQENRNGQADVEEKLKKSEEVRF